MINFDRGSNRMKANSTAATRRRAPEEVMRVVAMGHNQVGRIRTTIADS